MEEFKALDKVTEPDPRWESILDPSVPGKIRKAILRDCYEQIAPLELSDSVPETVRSAFNATRMLWVYGFFYWPLHTRAMSEALLCLSMALALRIAKEDGITDMHSWRVPTLKKMFDRAIKSKWVIDDGIAHVKRGREQRRRELDEFPENSPEELGASPDTGEQPPQRYCRILLESFPDERDRFAHPKHYWHGMPGGPCLTIENVHGLIEQLFHHEVVKS